MVSATSSSPCSVALLTSTGTRRTVNQDAALALGEVPLFAVANGTDGMEAAQAALRAIEARASQLVARIADVRVEPTSSRRLALSRSLEALVAHANAAAFDAGDALVDRRPAAAVSVATLIEGRVFIAHVGDCRVYLVRRGRLHQLTSDHTIAALQLRRGDITAADFDTSPFRRTLAQSLGITPVLSVDLLEFACEPGDGLLLATNGLHRTLTDDVIAQCLTSGNDVDAQLANLRRALSACGAPDDVTAVWVRTKPTATATLAAPSTTHDAARAMTFPTLDDHEWHQLVTYLDLIEVPSTDLTRGPPLKSPGWSTVVAGDVITATPTGPDQRWGVGTPLGALTLIHDPSPDLTLTSPHGATLCTLSRSGFEEIIRVNPALGGKLTLILLDQLTSQMETLTATLGRVVEVASGRA